jgi:hypothetical protein
MSAAQPSPQRTPNPPDTSEIPEIPFGFVEGDEVHDQTWQEKYHAAEATLKARAWSSDFLAAFRTAQAFFARECHDGLREAYGADWAKVLEQSFKVYAALIDAAAEDTESKSKVRRFPCPAWKAQTYLSRTVMPPLDDEEFDRVSGTLARAWQRLGWTWIHKLQLISGVALFECETIEFKKNQAKKPATYTDRFTDLLLATIRKARASRERKRVNKFDLAFQQCLKEFREQKLIPDYAPEAKKPDEKAARAKAKAEAQKMTQEPTVQVEGIARRATAKAAKIVADLPGDEALAVDIALVEWITDEWKKATGRVLPFPPVPPVEEADTTFSAAPATASSCASPQGQDCEFPAENDETASSSADNLSYETPAQVSVEYDPEPEPRGQSLAEAEEALDAFESVGVLECTAVIVDDALPRGQNEVFSEQVTVAEFRRHLERYMGRNESNSTHSLCGRVSGKKHKYGTRRLIQVDDCSREVVRLLMPFAFLVAMTSPGNYQVWIALSDVMPDDKEFEDQRLRLYQFLKPTGANGGAYGSIRWPGTLNRKPSRRYADASSPRVQLLRTQPGRMVGFAELDAAGLLAPLPPKRTPEQIRKIKGRLPKGWPDFDEFLSRHRGDRSTAEFAWSCRALELGWPRYSVEDELSRIGAKARTRTRDNYVSETVSSAARQVGVTA